jgi:hypothetical protein
VAAAQSPGTFITVGINTGSPTAAMATLAQQLLPKMECAHSRSL